MTRPTETELRAKYDALLVEGVVAAMVFAIFVIVLAIYAAPVSP